MLPKQILYKLLQKKYVIVLLGNILIINYLNRKKGLNTNILKLNEPQRKIYSWGNGIYGQLGTGDEMMNQNIPIEIQELNDYKIKKIYASFDNSAALTKDGQFLVWGKSRDGSIGQIIGGGTKNITVPSLFTYFDDIDGRIRNVSISREHGGLVTEEGKIYTWGIDLYGKLGHDEKERIKNEKSARKTQPKITYENIRFGEIKHLNNEKIIDIKCGYNHTVCLSDNGSVFSWGYGKDGALGHGDIDNCDKPKKIKYFDENNIKIKEIQSGMNFCLALSEDGRIFSWGKNEYGQLGLGNKTQQTKVNTPQSIPLNNLIVKEIFCGEDHSGIITDSNEGFIWGYGMDGRLGNKKKTNSNIPIKLTIEDKNLQISKISCGGHHTAIISQNGNLFMCGTGRDGELGNGDILQSNSVSRNEPILVMHFNLMNEKVLDVSCGSSHTIAITEKELKV